MPILELLITTGRIADVMLSFIIIEILVIVIYRRRTGRGIAALPLFLNAGAGGSLILALRASLTGAGWAMVAPFLVSALFFHVADLWQRWSRPPTANA